MTTLGTLGTAHTLVCDNLIVKNIQDEVKTKKILFKNGSDTLWSIGYDDETNFVLTNEHANPSIVSISASIDNGDVFIKGGGSGGASTLSELTDVTTSGVQNGEILFYNGLTSKYEFSNNLINVNELRGSSNIQIKSNYTNSSGYIEITRDKINAINSNGGLTPLFIESDINVSTIQSNDVLNLKAKHSNTANYLFLNENVISASTPTGGDAEIILANDVNLDGMSITNINEVSCNSLIFTQATIPNYTGINLNQLYYNATTKEVTYDVIPPGASVFTVDGNFAYASKNIGFKTSTPAQTTEAVNIFGNIRFNSSNNQSRYLLCDAAFDLKASPTDTSYIEFYQNRMMGKSSNGPNTES